MEEQILEKLRAADRELHRVIVRLSEKKTKRSVSLRELNRIMRKEAILNVDTTKLIRSMREKNYE